MGQMHRQWWTALAWGFAVAMGVLLFLSGQEAPPPVVVTTATTVTRGSALPPAPEPPVVVEAAKAEAYRGNIKTKKFHRLTCRYASCPNCRAKFATREEAIAEGFDPCGVCDP